MNPPTPASRPSNQELLDVLKTIDEAYRSYPETAHARIDAFINRQFVFNRLVVARLVAEPDRVVEGEYKGINKDYGVLLQQFNELSTERGALQKKVEGLKEQIKKLQIPPGVTLIPTAELFDLREYAATRYRSLGGIQLPEKVRAFFHRNQEELEKLRSKT